LEEGSPKKVFLKETIEKEVRLSYLERIQKAFPESYSSLFPNKINFEQWTPISSTFLHTYN
jgi:MIF4G like